MKERVWNKHTIYIFIYSLTLFIFFDDAFNWTIDESFVEYGACVHTQFELDNLTRPSLTSAFHVKNHWTHKHNDKYTRGMFAISYTRFVYIIRTGPTYVTKNKHT